MARAMVGVMCVIFVFCFVVLPISCIAKDYTVGDVGGWSINVDYSTWASDKTFAVGDTLGQYSAILIFNYGGGHTVAEVSESDYTSCTIGNSVTSDSSGASSIILSTPGTHYFVCGVVGHCDSGMKLAVTVATDDLQATPATSTATPTLPSPPASSTTPLVPAPPAASTATPLPSPGSKDTLPSSPLPSSTSTSLSPLPSSTSTSPSALLDAPTPLLAPPTTASTLSTAATTLTPSTTTNTNLAPPFAEASSTSTNSTPTLALIFLVGITLSNLFHY